MSEHTLVAALGIAFTAAFLGGLLEFTRLQEAAARQDEEEKAAGQDKKKQPRAVTRRRGGKRHTAD